MVLLRRGAVWIAAANGCQFWVSGCAGLRAGASRPQGRCAGFRVGLQALGQARRPQGGSAVGVRLDLCESRQQGAGLVSVLAIAGEFSIAAWVGWICARLRVGGVLSILRWPLLVRKRGSVS